MANRNKKSSSKNSLSTSTTLGIGLIGLGALWLFGQFFDFNFGANLWPFFVIVPGVFLLSLGLSTETGGEKLSTVGSIITATGLLLLYQNWFDHFESWAYAWALILPGSVGLGQLLYAGRQDDEKLALMGRRLVTMGASVFLVGAVFFEIILNFSGRGIAGLSFSSYFWPILIIAAGVFILFRRSQINGPSHDEPIETSATTTEPELDPGPEPEPEPEPEEPPKPARRASTAKQTSTAKRASTKKRPTTTKRTITRRAKSTDSSE